MKCERVRIYLSPYLDSELDPTITYEVSRHLEGCPECAQIFQAEEGLERAIGEQLRRLHGDEDEVIERGLERVFARASWPLTPRVFLAATSLLVLFVVLGLYVFQQHSNGDALVPELITMAAKDHRSHIRGDLSPDLVTADPAALPSYFQGKLAGDTGPLPAGNGWQMEGARVCRFRDIPVGFVTLRYRGIPVSVIDVPRAEMDNGIMRDSAIPPDDQCFDLPGGRGILRRTSFGLRVVFGDVEMAQLEEVVLAAR